MTVDELRELFAKNGFELTDGQAQQFHKFLELFLDYNQKVNLSAIRDADGVVEKHFIDSLHLLNVDGLQAQCRLLDLGSGGGFPGIPLKIMLPELKLTLLDSVRKKVTAMEYFATELGLYDVESVWQRAEDHAQDALGRYDWVVARAVAYMPQVLRWCEPLLTADGQIALFKSPSPEELAAGKAEAADLRLELKQSIDYELAGQVRSLLIFNRLQAR